MESGAQCVTITLEYQKRGLCVDNLGFLITSTTLMLVLAAALFPGIQVTVINKINACVLDVTLCMCRFYEPKKIIIVIIKSSQRAHNSIRRVYTVLLKIRHENNIARASLNF